MPRSAQGVEHVPHGCARHALASLVLCHLSAWQNHGRDIEAGPHKARQAVGQMSPSPLPEQEAATLNKLISCNLFLLDFVNESRRETIEHHIDRATRH